MPKKMLIDATHAEETRVVVVDGNKVEEFDFETLNKRQLAGNIYLAKVTRVEPSLQAAFVDYGGNRHGFLAFAEIHPDYYQIPVADRKALIEEERAMARAEEEEENRRDRRRSPKPRAQAEDSREGDATTSGPSGMDLVDLDDDSGDDTQTESQDHDNGDDTGNAPYRAMDNASETDSDIESVADEDVSEEISAPRKPRARKYKIQEVVKVRQILLIQVVKEERGNKGAALTTYLSLAGRYCVLMPNTARGGGISRKITNIPDRKKLKEIAGEIQVPEGAGLIIRTAGAKRTKPEIKRDYEYLMRLWEQIRELTLKSIAPAPIYEEGNLIKRSIRDLYNREIDEVLVEGAEGFRVAKEFMRMIMPTHARAVQLYQDPTPLFARHQVESYLAGMFNPTVQLKSGGYIVIGITEALVAIDVNSGRSTREGSIEDTALKTNLEAAEEVARQLRLRDLAGLIVIDFIDMEERRNNLAVEKRLKDKLKTDRARIQVGRISGFGLLEMSRQRLRPGMLESTTQQCSHCHGTGLIRSDDSAALQVLRALEEEGTRKRSKEVLLRAPVGIINYLVNHKREHIALIEARYGMAVRLEADPSMIAPDYTIEKFKTALRVVPEPGSVISGNASMMGAPVDEYDDPELPIDDDDDDLAEDIPTDDEGAAEDRSTRTNGDSNGDGKKKRRRRRRRKIGTGQDADGQTGDNDSSDDGDDDEATTSVVAEETADTPDAAASEGKPKGRSRSRGGRSRSGSRSVTTETDVPSEAAAEVATTDQPASDTTPEAEAEPEAEVKPKRTRAPRAKAKPAESTDEAAAKPARTPRAPRVPKAAKAETEATSVSAPEPVAETVPAPETAPAFAEAAAAPSAPESSAPADSPPDTGEATEKPKRKGWWSLGR
jgi:ribonuclease E